MSFLLDSDTCSAYLKGDRNVGGRIVHHFGALHVSVMSVGERTAWVMRASAPPGRRTALDELLSDLVVLDVDFAVARRFGTVRAELWDRGLPPPDVDPMIACTALEYDLTLVTHNTRDYANIPGLRLLDWVLP